MSLASDILKGAGTGAAAGSVVPGWGTAIGAVGGAAMGLWKGIVAQRAEDERKSLLDKQQEDEDNLQNMINRKRNIDIGLNTNSNGYDFSQNMYAAFGNTEIAPIEYQPEKINGAQPINSTASVLKGPSHEEGGVSLSNVSSDPKAEAEGEEVIVQGKNGNPDDSMIFSARLQTPDGQTFAHYAAEFSKAKGVNETRMVTTDDRYLVDSLERENEIIDIKLAKLFKLQGMIKEQQQQQRQQ